MHFVVCMCLSGSQVTEIERFSDRFKQKAQGKREALAHYLKLTPSNFPSELIQGNNIWGS